MHTWLIDGMELMLASRQGYNELTKSTEAERHTKTLDAKHLQASGRSVFDLSAHEITHSDVRDSALATRSQ
jgi:hypothetical protein